MRPIRLLATAVLTVTTVTFGVLLSASACFASPAAPLDGSTFTRSGSGGQGVDATPIAVLAVAALIVAVLAVTATRRVVIRRHAQTA
jgi:hypothetical protein